MFLELPELCSAPFPSLETIIYEGQINPQTLNYLTLYSPNLRSLHLLCPQSVLKATCLENFHLEPKPYLETLLLEFVLEADGDRFIKEARKVIDQSASLKTLGKQNFAWTLLNT